MAIEKIEQKKKPETFMKKYPDDKDMDLVMIKDETERVIRTEETIPMICDTGENDETLVNAGSATEFTYDENGNLTQDEETGPFHSEKTTRKLDNGSLVSKETQSFDNKKYYREPHNFTKKTTYYKEGKPDYQVSFKLDEDGKEIINSKTVKYYNPKNGEFED